MKIRKIAKISLTHESLYTNKVLLWVKRLFYLILYERERNMNVSEMIWSLNLNLVYTRNLVLDPDQN